MAIPEVRAAQLAAYLAELGPEEAAWVAQEAARLTNGNGHAQDIFSAQKEEEYARIREILVGEKGLVAVPLSMDKVDKIIRNNPVDFAGGNIPLPHTIPPAKLSEVFYDREQFETALAEARVPFAEQRPFQDKLNRAANWEIKLKKDSRLATVTVLPTAPVAVLLQIHMADSQWRRDSGMGFSEGFIAAGDDTGNRAARYVVGRRDRSISMATTTVGNNDEKSIRVGVLPVVVIPR